MKSKITLATTILALIAASLLFAQGPPNAPDPPSPQAMAERQAKMLTTVLSLSNAQQQQVRTIFTKAATDASALHDNLKIARESLSDAVKSNDIATINQASNAIGKLVAQMTATKAKADATLFQILTPDQQNKLTELEKEGPGRLMVGGPPPF